MQILMKSYFKYYVLNILKYYKKNFAPWILPLNVLYVPAWGRRRKLQPFFYLSVGLSRIWLGAFLCIHCTKKKEKLFVQWYIYVSLQFLLPAVNKFLIQYSTLIKINSHRHCTKVKFPIKDLFSKCGQIRSFRRMWSHLLKKSSLFVQCSF